MEDATLDVVGYPQNSFLSYPYEIRQMIYSFVLVPDHDIFVTRDANHAHRYKEPSRPHLRSFRVSKQVYLEAADTFYSENTFAFAWNFPSRSDSLPSEIDLVPSSKLRHVKIVGYDDSGVLHYHKELLRLFTGLETLEVQDSITGRVVGPWERRFLLLHAKNIIKRQSKMKLVVEPKRPAPSSSASVKLRIVAECHVVPNVGPLSAVNLHISDQIQDLIVDVEKELATLGILIQDW